MFNHVNEIDLQYPAIAPFYSNVDTTDANETSSISYFKSYDPEILNRASNYVKLAFDEASDFQATSVFIATWANVGHYQAKNDVGNTFQVCMTHFKMCVPTLKTRIFC